MPELSDLLLLLGAMSSALFCYVLSRRLRRFMALDNGIGAAIASLSRQVDGMQSCVDAARKVTSTNTDDLQAVVSRAELVASRLELLLAAASKGPVTPKAMAPATPKGALVASLRDMKRSMQP